MVRKLAILSLLFAGTLAAAPEPLQRDTKTKELVQTELNLKSVTFTIGNVTISDAAGIRTFDFGSTNGTKLGATNSKMAFFGATPIVKPTGNVLTALTNLNLVGTPSLTEANITGLSTSLGNKQPLDSDLTSVAALATTVFGRDFLVMADAAAARTKLGLAIVASTGLYSSLSGLPVLPADTNPVATRFFTGYDAPTGTFEVITPDFTDIDGVATADQIPDLDAAKITTGAFDPARIPSLDATKITTGSFDAARIPDLDAAKIASGALAKARQYAATAYEDETNVFTANQDSISQITGSITMRSLATPGAPTVDHTGVAGATTWSYRIVAKLPDGTVTVGGATGSTTSGNATLDTNNFNTLSWTAVPGASSYDVYRTVAGFSPTSLGKITTVAVTSYNDQGAAGDSAAVPSTNTTGRLSWLADNTSDIGDASASRPRDVNAGRDVNAASAITAATAVVSGNTTIGGTTTSTGKVTGPIVDKGGQFHNVVAYGGVSGTNTYTAAQAAANAISAQGGELHFPDGDWLIERTILIKTGTRVTGSAGARIIPVATGSFTPISDAVVGGTVFTVFANTNCFAGTITDVNITFENLKIGPVNAVNFGGFGIFIRKAQNVKVINCTGQYMNEMATFLASKDTRVEGCKASNLTIAAFDHWEGPLNAVVTNCTVYDSPHAVLFNSEATIGDAAHLASNLVVENGEFIRCSSGAIYVAPLNANDGSTIKTVKLIHNHINQDAQAYPGIVVASSSDVTILDNTIEGVAAANIITIGAESASFPSAKFYIDRNTFLNCTIGTNTYIVALGTEGHIEGNRTVNSTATGGTALQVDSPTTLILENPALAGATVYLVNATNLGVPTTPGIHSKANTGTQTIELTGNLSASGTVTGTNLVPGYVSTQTISSPGAITFNGIPSTYNELTITFTGRSATAAVDAPVLLNFNNDFGANYEWIEFAGVTQTAQTSARVGKCVAGSGPATYPGSIVLTIPGYSGTTFYKGFPSMSVSATASGVLVPLNEFGVWKSAAAITRVDFNVTGGFAVGSTATLVAR